MKSNHDCWSLICFGLFFIFWDDYHFVDLTLLWWDKPARRLASFRDAFIG